MILAKIRDPKIDPKAPWADDYLERRQQGEILTRLIDSLDGQYVIALKGDWGSGKSVFLRRLSCHLELEGIPVVSVDAWRSDNLEDPLLAFVSAISERLRGNGKAVVATNKIISGLAKHGARLIVPTTTLLTNLLLPGAGAVINEVAQALNDSGEYLLKLEEEQRKSAEEFRELVEKARNSLDVSRKGRKRIVIAIDELDRCRPDFSIKMLERIKHFFDVDGVIFLVATDGRNLPNYVSSVYGDKVDGEVYLRKFFDFEFHLKTPTTTQFMSILKQQFGVADRVEQLAPNLRDIDIHARILGTQYAQAVKDADRGIDFVEFIAAFEEVANRCNLSLRDQAQAFTIGYAYLSSIPERQPIFPSVIAFAVCLRYFDHGLYESLRSGRTSLQGAVTRLQQEHPMEFKSSWFSKTPTGLDVHQFADLANSNTPEAHLQGLRNGLRAENSDRSIGLSVNRLLVRTARVQPEMPRTYLREALSLANAFAEPVEEG